MSAFQEVTRQWKRMCTGRVRCDCPMAAKLKISNCGLCRDTVLRQSREAEVIIMTWAAEHPEPQYPTWIEYLVGIGVIPEQIPMETADALMDTNLLKPIPSNIAQTLGLQPKEAPEKKGLIGTARTEKGAHIMDDLISRAAAKEMVRGLTKRRVYAGYRKDDTTTGLTYDDVQFGLDFLPAVDAVPVEHGRWEEQNVYYVCNACGAKYKDEIVLLYDGDDKGGLFSGFEHCPHCGAKMDCKEG